LNSLALDIVLPCYNPIPGWSTSVIQSLTRLQEALPKVSIYPIIVNDGSIGGIQPNDIALIQEYFPQLIYLENQENRGKGFTLRRGVEAAQHDICIYTDIDFPYTLESIVAIYQPLALGQLDIAVGIKDASYYKHIPPSRVWISKGLRWMARSFLQISITDTQCGLKGFNKKGKAIFLQTTINRYLADLEFIFLADQASAIEMRPIPIRLKEGIVFSHVNMKVLIGEGINFLKVMGKTLVNKSRVQDEIALENMHKKE